MNIGIVGCGDIIDAHIVAIRKSVQDFNLYLCDKDLEKAKAIKNKNDVTGIFSDFDEMLSKIKFDSVHILTPPTSHVQLAKKALLANCNVIIEKPPANTVEEMKYLYELSEKKGKILCVDHSLLGMPVVQKALKDIKSGLLGRLVAIHCHFGSSANNNHIPYQSINHWAYNLVGGILENWASHPASLIMEIIDPIKEHKTIVLQRNILPNDCPDLLHVSMANEDQIGSFTLSMGHGTNERHANILLENGEIFIDITRQLYSCVVNKGRQKFIKKALSGIEFGLSLTYGTVANILNVLRGRLTSNPGIVNVVNSYYKAIESIDNLIISKNNVMRVTELLEKVWQDVGYIKNTGRNGCIPIF